MFKLKDKQFPSKTTVNLMIREESAYRISRIVCGTVIAAIVIALFCKFAVIDRWSAVREANSAADSAERRLEELQSNNASYEEVRTEYAKYFTSVATEENPAPANCMEVIDLVEKQLLAKCGVESMSFVQNTLTVRLTGTSLRQASAMIDALNGEPLVASVEINTADDTGGEEAEGATIDMVISLTAEGGAGK